MDNNNINKEKPLSLIIKECRENIESVINNSGLPPYLLEPILKDYYNQVSILSHNMIVEEENEYLSSIKK